MLGPVKAFQDSCFHKTPGGSQMKLDSIFPMLESHGELERVIPPDGMTLERCGGIEINDCFHDTRKTKANSLFACVVGKCHDGHDFADEAICYGAVALLCERELSGKAVPQIIVKDVRRVLGYISAKIHGNPANSLFMVAVTGTNGKTTTTYMIRSILESAGYKTGMIGTVSYDTGKGAVEADRTTPESSDVQRMLAEMLHNDCAACVMEASSHGLVLGRLSGCLFDAAVFTNLTEEHLDFHKDMETYFSAKSLLFTKYMKDKSLAVINCDDPYGKRFQEIAGGKTVLYGIKKAPRQDETFLYGKIRSMNITGSSVEIRYFEGKSCSRFSLEIPLVGRYNVYNALAAGAFGLGSDIDAETVRKGVFAVKTVPGRLEKLRFEGGPSVVVDYAHTPDALEKVLEAVREICKGDIWLVFGLGGDRYKENRPIMGKIAAQKADRLIITMDNPRSEDPLDIAEAIKKGAAEAGCLDAEIIIDRKDAVYTALDRAKAEDVVLVTGKGPERYIIIGEKLIPYNDMETIEDWGRKRGRTKCLETVS